MKLTCDISEDVRQAEGTSNEVWVLSRVNRNGGKIPYVSVIVPAPSDPRVSLGQFVERNIAPMVNHLLYKDL